MNVRCQGCQAEVSEWAALCPFCRRSLDDAEVLADPEPPPPPPSEPVPVASEPSEPEEEAEEEEDPPPPAARPRGRMVALAALAVVALIGATVGVVGWSEGGRHANRDVRSGGSATRPAGAKMSPPSTLPADMAGELLFFAEPGRTGLFQADGIELSKIKVGGDGYPLEPLVSRLGIVVYIHNDHAYRTSVGASSPTTDLGPATWIFPGLGGTIGVQDGVGSGPSTIRYMAANGNYDRKQKGLTLPAGQTAIAQVPLGLVVASGANFQVPVNEVSHLRISLVMPGSSGSPVNGVSPPRIEYLGIATAVIGVHGPNVAWIDCPGNQSVDCSLSLVNTTELYTRVVKVPVNSSGFAQGGGFSPDGSRLAVFVQSGLANAGAVLRLEIYNLATGTLTPVGPPLPAEDPVGSATWSVDGLYLYFGGLLGDLYAEPARDIGRATAPLKLPLQASFSVVGY